MDLKMVIKQSEGRRLEFKENLPSKSDLCKTITAFANDAGGILLIGIKDSPRQVVGLPEKDLIIIDQKTLEGKETSLNRLNKPMNLYYAI